MPHTHTNIQTGPNDSHPSEPPEFSHQERIQTALERVLQGETVGKEPGTQIFMMDIEMEVVGSASVNTLVMAMLREYVIQPKKADTLHQANELVRHMEALALAYVEKYLDKQLH